MYPPAASTVTSTPRANVRMRCLGFLPPLPGLGPDPVVAPAPGTAGATLGAMGSVWALPTGRGGVDERALDGGGLLVAVVRGRS